MTKKLGLQSKDSTEEKKILEKNRTKAWGEFMDFSTELVNKYGLVLVGGVERRYLDGIRFEVGVLNILAATDDDKKVANEYKDSKKEVIIDK